MTSPASPSIATLLDGPAVPRVLLTLVALLLLVVLKPVGPAWLLLASALGVAAFCAWVWLPKAHRHRVGPPLGVVLATASLAVTADIGILMVLGATTLLRSVRPRRGLLVVAVLAAALVLRRLERGDLGDLPAVGAESLLVVLALVLLDTTSSATRELRATRDAVFGEVVDVERMRLGDRLRSLIGRTLLTARRDLRHAAAAADPSDSGTTEQLRALEAVLADGLDQLDRLTVEPVAEGLQVELEAARDVCERLGIAVTVSIDAILEPAIADVAALVLREAVTNMLKHAEATRCVIVVRATPEGTLLAVTNDGASPLPPADAHPGTGQRRWRAALEALDAELTTAVLDGDRYQVLVRFPSGRMRARS